VRFEHVYAVGGLALNVSPGAPTQVLPSLTVLAGAGDWRGVLGIFDQGGLIPARVGVGWRGFTLCYVPALGAELDATVPLTASLDLRARAFAYRLVETEAIDLVAGFGWRLP
jgi:hypothetical protein